MAIEPLDAAAARVLGCLLEKQLATPQYYPLSLSALVAAANQSSNRDPVTDYRESDVADALAGLREAGFVRVVHSSGNRVPKYRHVLDEAWGLDAEHRAVLAVLLLRGPQTIGELRARTERLSDFTGLDAIEEVLRLLAAREEPLVTRYERRPGQKEARFGHLLGGDHDPSADDALAGEARLETVAASSARPDALADRVSALEDSVEALQASLAQLRALLE